MIYGLVKGGMISAVLLRDFDESLAMDTGEGDWINLSGFDLVPVDGEFRPVKHLFRIECGYKAFYKKIPPTGL